MRDIRDDIFSGLAGRTFRAAIIAEDPGILAETSMAAQAARELGLSVDMVSSEGSAVKPGDEIIRFSGEPKRIAMAEDRLIGIMAKPSGIATSARRFVERAGACPRIVSGAWKKMPLSQKESIRRAIALGGASKRICDPPFLYLDKNYVKILGGVTACLHAVSGFNGHVRVIQLKGINNDINSEACQAAQNGAGIIFIDSGRIDDLDRVSDALKLASLRDRVEIAFGGNIQLNDIETLKKRDVDILDIGRAIVDAPLLDMRMEIMEA